jgi:ketosteroid isomerase-like protein
MASQEDVEVVRHYYAAQNKAFSEGTFRTDLLDLDIEIDMSRRLLDPEVYRGINEVRVFIEDIHASWEAYEVVPEEVLQAGEQFVAMVMVRGQGSLSGAAVEVRVAHVLRFRDHKLLRMEYFGDRDEGLRMAGGERLWDRKLRGWQDPPRTVVR